MIIGVTGGMGSGKTALTAMLAELGAEVVNADLVAHKVIAAPSLLEQLTEAFGGDIVDSSGGIARRVLGRKALRDKESLDELYSIIRPDLERALKSDLDRVVNASGGRIVIFDAPLIYEWEIQDWVDAVVLVDCEEDTRVERVIARGGLERGEILRRMALQMDVGEKKTRADIVIDNNGDMTKLQEQAIQLWKRLIALSDSEGENG